LSFFLVFAIILHSLVSGRTEYPDGELLKMKELNKLVEIEIEFILTGSFFLQSFVKFDFGSRLASETSSFKG